MKKVIALAAVAVLVLTSSGIVSGKGPLGKMCNKFGKPHRGPHGGPMGHRPPDIMRMADELELSDEQFIALRSHMKKTQESLQPLFEQMHDFHKQSREIAEADTFDEEKFRAVMKLEAEIMCEVKITMIKSRSEFEKTLTAEQQQKLAELKENRQRRHERREATMEEENE